MNLKSFRFNILKLSMHQLYNKTIAPKYKDSLKTFLVIVIKNCHGMRQILVILIILYYKL